jgi:hypothetical protein
MANVSVLITSISACRPCWLLGITLMLCNCRCRW